MAGMWKFVTVCILPKPPCKLEDKMVGWEGNNIGRTNGETKCLSFAHNTGVCRLKGKASYKAGVENAMAYKRRKEELYNTEYYSVAWET